MIIEEERLKCNGIFRRPSHLVPSEGGFYFYRLELGTAAKEPFLYFILVNKAQRHIRGGMATREKYQHRVAICSREENL